MAVPFVVVVEVVIVVTGYDGGGATPSAQLTVTDEELVY